MAQRHAEGGSENGGPVITIGLLADPGAPAKAAERLADDLPGLLSDRIDDTVVWRVDVRCEPLVLDGHGDIPIAVTARATFRKQGWDYLIAITGLPRSLGPRPLLFSLDRKDRTGLLSLPATGWIRRHRHAREAVLRLLEQLVEDDPRFRHTRRGAHGPGGLGEPAPAGLFSSVRESGRGEDGQEHVVLSGLRGQVRLLLGMVLANRPWRLVPSLSSAFAAALATGSFGVFYNTIWSIADALSPLRLTLVTGFAVTAMTVWLIVYNGLWEPVRDFHRSGSRFCVKTGVSVDGPGRRDVENGRTRPHRQRARDHHDRNQSHRPAEGTQRGGLPRQ
jgi:hypothetical protein